MQIVIDIPDSLYENILICWENIHPKVWKILKDGTPLPKGHGRLIDAEQLMNYCQNQIDGHKYADCNVIARFPTILDAEVEHECKDKLE